MAVVVHAGPVAVIPHAGEAAPVGLEVAFRVAPDAARHGRRRFGADEVAHAVACGVPFSSTTSVAIPGAGAPSVQGLSG